MEIKTKDFIQYLEQEGLKVYRYRGGYYKAFFGNAYAVFETTPYLANVIVRGKFPNASILKALVERFFEERGVKTYYYPDRDLITTAFYEKPSEEEVLELFRSVYG